MTRLRTVSAQDTGWTRRRRGTGFGYVDDRGRPLPAAAVERVRALAIPPAWREVWICPDELGHLQATGVDDAGRTQYLYHPEWRRKRDAAKYDRVIAMARRLPGVRRKLDGVLADGGAGRDQVLAAAVRLIDLGLFRVGSDDYTETHGSFGLTTMERRHVHRHGDGHLFEFVGKSGVEHAIVVEHRSLDRVVDAITYRRKGTSRFLSWRDGRSWRALSAADVNDYLDELFTAEVTSKDFRTWNGTVLVAVELAGVDRAGSRTGRKRQVNTALDTAAESLGNTRAVARSSYVDPRVVDRFEAGTTINASLQRAPRNPDRARDHIDRAVVRLLT